MFSWLDGLAVPGLFHSVVLTSNGNSYVLLGSEAATWDVADRVMASLNHPLLGRQF